MSPLDDQPVLLRAIIDANPSLMLVVDADVRIIDGNRAAIEQFNSDRQTIWQRRGGEVMRCLNAGRHADGCGQATACRDCVARSSVGEALKGRHVVRRRARFEVVDAEGGVSELHALITTAPLDLPGQRLVLLTIEDISVLAELWRVIPICACCKKIRDDDQYWTELEVFFQKSWDVRFTHGYCPDCMSELLAEAGARRNTDSKEES